MNFPFPFALSSGSRYPDFKPKFLFSFHIGFLPTSHITNTRYCRRQCQQNSLSRSQMYIIIQTQHQVLFEGSVNTFIFHFAYNIHIVIHPIIVVAINARHIRVTYINTCWKLVTTSSWRQKDAHNVRPTDARLDGHTAESPSEHGGWQRDRIGLHHETPQSAQQL